VAGGHTVLVPIRQLHLRPFGQQDLDLFARFAADPSFVGPFQWHGFRSFNELRRRWEDDEFLTRDPRYLVIASEDDVLVGWIMWRDPQLFGHPGSAWEVGLLLTPDQRGQGLGSAAHDLLVHHLFESTAAHRLIANTDVDNLAERRCLERSGFRCDGVLRQAGFRDGRWRDVATYSLLRGEVT
jgi:RimJ/RimL family protein N-acetyltransferase